MLACAHTVSRSCRAQIKWVMRASASMPRDNRCEHFGVRGDLPNRGNKSGMSRSPVHDCLGPLPKAMTSGGERAHRGVDRACSGAGSNRPWSRSDRHRRRAIDATPHPSHAWWRGDNELEAPRTAIGGSGNPMLTRRPPVEASQPSDETTQPSNQTTQPSDQTKQTRDGGRQQPAQVKRPRDELRRHRAKEIRPTIREHCSQ